MERELPEVRMIVGNYFSAGLYLLAGPPKSGKSLLALDLCLSVAMGQVAWGSALVDSGSAMYLALEGGDRAFRQRMDKMLQGEVAPERLQIAYEADCLGGRLETQIGLWLAQVDEPRLVVIDTYVAVAPKTASANRFQEEYGSLSGLAKLAEHNPVVLFLLIHHTNKATEYGDIMDRISGSTGLTAATDGNALLIRPTASTQGTLYIRPRNAEESELVLKHDAKTLRWSIEGNDERRKLSSSRQLLLDWLDEHPQGGMPAEIADELSMRRDNARKLLSMMASSGQVRHDARGGLYFSLENESEAA